MNIEKLPVEFITKYFKKEVYLLTSKVSGIFIQIFVAFSVYLKFTNISYRLIIVRSL